MESHPSNPKYNNVLLTSCGLFPQVITEIIFALSQQDPPVILDEIHVITTEVGLAKIKKYLLDKEDGFFYKLCDEYGLRGTKFELRNIQLLENAVGTSLEDIETLDDNEVVANSVTEAVRKLTSRPENALHVSLTGGRRTSSYYLGYALSLFGRSQDRLSHTIVSDGYAADDEFFYPNKNATFITDRQGKVLNTQDARVQLVEIPFVRLRDGLPERLLNGKTTFVEAVRSAPNAIQRAQLDIDLATRELHMNDVTLSLPPIQFGWYSWLVSRLVRLGAEESGISVRENQHHEFLAFIEARFGADHVSVERARKSLAQGFSIDYISEKNSRVNKAITRALNSSAIYYKIHSYGDRPNTSYRLGLAPEDVTVKPHPSCLNS